MNDLVLLNVLKYMYHTSYLTTILWLNISGITQCSQKYHHNVLTPTRLQASNTQIEIKFLHTLALLLLLILVTCYNRVV